MVDTANSLDAAALNDDKGQGYPLMRRLQKLLVAPLALVPEPLVWKLSQRYIAGTDLASAAQCVSELNALGCRATIDVLGEDSTSKSEVETAAGVYRAAFELIDAKDLDCNASVKLSDLGLRFDPSLCEEIMSALLGRARTFGNFIRIDMEDASVTTATLDLYRRLRTTQQNVGVVIQARLRRSRSDVRALLNDGIANVRLCKGIYAEPEEIAYRDDREIQQSYMELLEQLFRGHAERVCIATHDPVLVEHAEQTVARIGIDNDRYEFQMLLGVAEELRARLVARGHGLRVYVPFGERWYAYSMRRLHENPRIAMHIVKNIFKPRRRA